MFLIAWLPVLQVFAITGVLSYNTLSNQSLVGDGFENDEECIGNRMEALEFGRQCSRKCKKDTLCENTRKQCLCDGLCGMSCIKPDLSCPDLPKIENGNFFPKTTLFNTRVTYQCDRGYYLFGSQDRLCQGDEDWSGTPAECMSEREFPN